MGEGHLGGGSRRVEELSLITGHTVFLTDLTNIFGIDLHGVVVLCVHHGHDAVGFGLGVAVIPVSWRVAVVEVLTLDLPGVGHLHLGFNPPHAPGREISHRYIQNFT